MIYLAAGLGILFGAYLWQAHRFDKERRHLYAEISTGRNELALAHIAHREHTAKMADAHREDVAQLCQRIQAPELAVVEHQQAKTTDPDPFPPTDEQLSRQQELAAFVERMEQVENLNASILP